MFPTVPDAFEDEQLLSLRPDGSFRIGEDPGSPEDLRFDAVVDGRPLRAWLSASLADASMSLVDFGSRSASRRRRTWTITTPTTATS